MAKIEVGMLVRVVSPSLEYDNNSLVGKIGTVKSFDDSRVCEVCCGDDFWFTTLHHEGICACSLEPINPDHEPADEEFQQELKNLLGRTNANA